ncbi:hypothetical protein TcasGA2_TC031770 [Tribolium castaneum]|uniref:Uncharacterized protein n=1 Tax=Tribolium castaneum TaxID=7070 RepID=A0A139WNQ1_TRICA|nr:hypothetical protein TcasGA2_TC031770 [Tribolium castaneum]
MFSKVFLCCVLLAVAFAMPHVREARSPHLFKKKPILGNLFGGGGGGGYGGGYGGGGYYHPQPVHTGSASVAASSSGSSGHGHGGGSQSQSQSAAIAIGPYSVALSQSQSQASGGGGSGKWYSKFSVFSPILAAPFKMKHFFTLIFLVVVFICACYTAPADTEDTTKDSKSAFGPAFDEIVVESHLTVRPKSNARQARTQNGTTEAPKIRTKREIR